MKEILKSKYIHLLLSALALIIVINLNGCSSSSEINFKEFSGKIYSVGNEPFTGIAIQTFDGTAYKIMEESPVFKDLKNEQGKNVVIKVDNNKSAKWDLIYVVSFYVVK